MIVRTVLFICAVIASAAGCAANGDNATASDPQAAGATGRTVVPGSNSTVAGDAAATNDQQKWPMIRR